MTANIWNPGSTVIQKVDAENSFKSQSFVTTSHQTLFTLTEFAYVINTGSIAIWRNGQKLLKDVDYVEVSDSTFSLLVDVVAGEKIEAVAIIGSTLANTTLAQQAAADALAYKNAAATSESNAAASAGQASTYADIAEAAKVFVVSGIAGATYAAPLKSNLVNTDRFPLVNSEASNTLAGATLGDIKSVFKTFYDPATSVLSNKTFNLSNNSLLGTIAQFNAACSDADFVSTDGAATLSNKTLNLNTNTLSGTLAQFNSACTDADFVSLAGAETLTNKTLTTPVINGATGSTAAWNIGNGQFVKDTSGNVGIASPSTSTLNRLSLKQSTDNSASGLGFRVERLANDSSLIVGYRDNTDSWQINATWISTGAFKPITFHTSDVERMRIDSSGNVGIGIVPSNSLIKLHVAGLTHSSVISTSASGVIGWNLTYGGSPSNWRYVDNGFGWGAYGDGSGNLNFSYSPSGVGGDVVSSRTTRLQLRAAGDIVASGGIRPSDASDVLSVYDEAIWTPTLNGITISGTNNSSYNYTRIGRLVTLNIILVGTTSVTVNADGYISLPITPNSAGVGSGVMVNEGTTAFVQAVCNLGNVYMKQAISAGANVKLVLTFTYMV